MTEAEWLAATDPEPMLKHLWSGAGERKRRLAVLAFCRRVWHRMDGASRSAVEAAERCADGWAAAGEVADAHREAMRWAHTRSATWRGDHADTAVAAAVAPELNTARWPSVGAVVGSAAMAAAAFAELAGKNRRDRKRRWRAGYDAERHAQAALVRCVFGNPFGESVFNANWRTETVTALAAGVYEHRAFDRIPILADALDDAGCDSADALAHLRGPGPHARGCWVVDLVLGKG